MRKILFRCERRGRNHFFNEREITFLDIVPPKGHVRSTIRRRRVNLPYEIPIISMRVKFPIGTYNLNGFLQASMLHLFKPSACPLRFASGTHLFFQRNCFYFPQCRHGLAGSAKPCRFWHGQTSNPKVSLRTSWRLLRRLIGENLFHAVCQRWGSCGSSILNRSPPCNPNWDCFF